MTDSPKTRFLIFLGAICFAGMIIGGLLNSTTDSDSRQVSVPQFGPSDFSADVPLPHASDFEFTPIPALPEKGYSDGEFLATQKSPYEVRQAAAYQKIEWDSQVIQHSKVNAILNADSEVPPRRYPIRRASSIPSSPALSNSTDTEVTRKFIPPEPHHSAVNPSTKPLVNGTIDAKWIIESQKEGTSFPSGKRYPLSQTSAVILQPDFENPNDPSATRLLGLAPPAPVQRLQTETANFQEPQLIGSQNDFQLRQPPAPEGLVQGSNKMPKRPTEAMPPKPKSPKDFNEKDFNEKDFNEKDFGNAKAASTDVSDEPDKPDGDTDKDDNQFRVARATKPPAKKPAAAKKDETPHALLGAEHFELAAQPKLGDHWKDDRPLVDNRAALVVEGLHGFSPDPIDKNMPYDPYPQMQVYEGKTLNANQRPILELGRPWYQLGQLSEGYSWFGKHNNITPQFLIYGDVRTAVASNSQNGDNVSQVAFEANLDFDLKLTGTERFHMFISPVDGGEQNTRWLLDDDRFVEEFDADIDFGYFEGDLGAIVGGFTNQTLPFDLPFAVGVMPLLLQNGVWLEDAFLGVAATIPARNSPRFNISNMDVTFFAGYDKITSDAFQGDDSAARIYGMASFIEALNGYFEIDYAFLDDRTFDDRSYHNIGIGFTRRYGRLISNSTRVIVNAGQDSTQVANTADGVLLLSENSLITSNPSTLVPYANFFAGFDRPQSAARAAGSGGVLRNTGILFESDGITGYPTLDPTANDTFGGALGLNIIADDFSQQLVVEMAMLGVMNEDAQRNAAGPQYGLGFRYQLPLTNAIIFRADGMYGFLEDDEDIQGLRMELRRKY